MKSDYRILAIILTFAMLFICVSCAKPTPSGEAANTDKPAATEPAATDEPEATEAPATEVPAAEAPADEAAELPAIIGHYVLLEGGALYDLDTGMVAATGVKEFIPFNSQSVFGWNNVNLAILENGELIGWHELGPDDPDYRNFGELQDTEYHPTPVHLLDGVVKAQPGCAINEAGQLIVWGAPFAGGYWDDLTAEQQEALMQPRVLMENAADIKGRYVLLKDSSLYDFGSCSAGLAEEPEFIGDEVKTLYPNGLYLKFDDTLHNWLTETVAENVAEIYITSHGLWTNYYLDTDGNLSVPGVFVDEAPTLYPDVSRVVMDWDVLENVGYDYFFVFMKDGSLWDYTACPNGDPVRIADGAKDVISDGANIYVLMNDNSLWAYTADEKTVYNEPESRIAGERTLVKVMDGVAACGVEMDMEDNGEEGPCWIRSTFRIVTEDGRFFNWGFVDGETVAEPAEIYLMR